MINFSVYKGVIPPVAVIEAMKSGAKIKFVDATYAGPRGKDAYNKARIGNAVYFDIDEIADPHSSMPHMLPAPEDFAKAAGKLGIGNDDLVIVYDQAGIAMAASRAWWMFRVFGHENVWILDGGLPYWQASGGPMNTDPAKAPAPAVYKASFRPELVKNMTEVQQAVKKKSAAIIDARSTDRFAGDAPEPRPGMRAGHIPGALNLPYSDLIGRDGRLLEPEALKSALSAYPQSGEVIASCGSGVTACVLALGMFAAGKKDVAVYDGSWTEWGHEDAGTAIETAA